MITVENLSYSRADRYLYRKASFTVNDGEHCVLIGGNGTGKSTLIDLILNTDDYLYKGKVTKTDIKRVGYVNQFIESEKDRDISVFEYLSEDFLLMQSKLDVMCEKLDSDEAMDEYQTLLDEFMAVDGYNCDVNIHHELHIAGLDGIPSLPLSAISGGEYKLVQIIRQMLRLPDILVMDEPDVFLDFENLLGLRELINAYTGTMLVATHNRYILNNCFDKILQIENENIQEYEGSYAEFCATQLEMKAAMQEISQKEAEFIAFEEAVVERMRDDATKVISVKKGKTLHARVSYVERWKKRHIEEPYVEDRMPQIALPVLDEAAEKPEYVLKAENYGVFFDKPLLENVSFTVLPGEKVALVGANGTGKTTLLREIWSAASPSLTVGDNVSIDFLSQFHGETLPEIVSVRQFMQSLGFDTDRSAMEVLQKYCFGEDILDQSIRTLSGGEKNLLQLARIGLGKGNFLLLDEPTSHLDLRSQIALENAINKYSGSVLMVSHDFYTIANCTDYVLFAENGTIRKMSTRAFRKMIYKKYFPQSYLELEQKKKELEMQINSRLLAADYKSARELCHQLDEIVEKLGQL